VLRHYRSVVHVIVRIEILPVHRVRIIVITFFGMLMEMIEDSIRHSTYRPGVLTNFFKGLNALVFFGRIFFRCHFGMITQKRYLRFVAAENMREETYVALQTKGRALCVSPPNRYRVSATSAIRSNSSFKRCS